MPVSSRPAPLFSIAMALVVILLLLAAAGLFAGAIWLLVMEEDEPMLLRLFLPVIAAVIFVCFYLLFLKGARYTDLIIDAQGLHYYNRFSKKIIKELPWKQFAANPVAGASRYELVYDIGKRTTSGIVNGARISADLVVWWEKGVKKAHTSNFRGTHVAAIFYANRGELIAAFLQGIRSYRPDLRIDPQLFTTFFINAASYQYERKKELQVEIFVWILLALIAGGIYLYVSSRH